MKPTGDNIFKLLPPPLSLCIQFHPCCPSPAALSALPPLPPSLPPYTIPPFLPRMQRRLEQAQPSYKKAAHGGGRAAVQQELCRHSHTHTGNPGTAAPLALGSRASATQKGQYRGRGLNAGKADRETEKREPGVCVCVCHRGKRVGGTDKWKKMSEGKSGEGCVMGRRRTR